MQQLHDWLQRTSLLPLTPRRRWCFWTIFISPVLWGIFCFTAMEAFFACQLYYAVSSNPKPKEDLCSSTWGATKKPCFVNSYFQLSFNCVLQLHSLWCIAFAHHTYFHWVSHLGKWALWISFANGLQCLFSLSSSTRLFLKVYQFLIWEKSQVFVENLLSLKGEEWIMHSVDGWVPKGTQNVYSLH